MNELDSLASVRYIVDDVHRLRATGVPLASDMVSGPGGRQMLVADPAGNLIELFEPAGAGAPRSAHNS